MANKVGTIRDVAKETKLSTATVSRVMNGNPKVNPELRVRVLEAAKLLNYVPNPAARALSTNRSKTIAAIIPTIEHSVFAKTIAAVEQVLSEQGYTLVLAISNSNKELELAAAEKLIAMGAEAFILTGLDHADDLLGLLKRRGKPVVFTSVFDATSDIPTIGYDNARLASFAVEHLRGYGHTNIAVVHGPIADSDRINARREGAIAALKNYDRSQFFEVDLNVEGGRSAAKKILELIPRPSAILCFSDVLALGVMFHMQSVDLTIPKDISVMGFDNLDWSKDSHPSLTTIDLPATKMGKVAANMVINQLENADPIISKELSANIIIRNSVGKMT